MEKSQGVPEAQTIGVFNPLRQSAKPQEYYESIKQKFAEERDLRLVALGLGPETGHVSTFYPEAVANVPLPKFAETIGRLIENVLLG